MTIVSNVCKPDNLESYNSLKLSFTNIWGLHSNYVGCEHSLNQTFQIFLLMWHKRGRLNWFQQFLGEVLPSFYLTFKRILLLIYILLKYMQRVTSFSTRLTLRKLWRFLFLFWTGFSSIGVVLFALSITIYLFVHSFCCFSYKIDEVLSINPSANLFFLES